MCVTVSLSKTAVTQGVITVILSYNKSNGNNNSINTTTTNRLFYLKKIIHLFSHYSLLFLMLELQCGKKKYLSVSRFDCTTNAETNVLELHVPHMFCKEYSLRA